ncbi:hypothetical protein ANRL2_03566 [Anaerolineae bacterium]|nr:hypothetical protein ANRL2_03566 [Anaerolineae bacterium]
MEWFLKDWEIFEGCLNFLHRKLSNTDFVNLLDHTSGFLNSLIF